MLVRRATDDGVGDADGLPCHLETETVEHLAYHGRHGFDVRSEWDVPTGPHMWGVDRPPN